MILSRIGAAVVIAVVSCAMTGCGERLYRVKGNVTFEGKPLSWGGSISFVPTGTVKIREAGSVINEDGTFELMTNKPGDGAMAGDYRVVIHQVTAKEPKNSGDNGKAASGLWLPHAERIPAKYSDSYNSPLSAKVEAKSVNEINFQLKRD